MTEYKASIVIPTYNSREHLRECIDSAIRQTLDKIEIIVINDASTDDTRDIIEELAARNDNIVTIEHDANTGQGAARNDGIDLARGKYVFFLDSDDSIPPYSLEVLFDIAEEYGSDIVFGKTCSEVAQDGNYIVSEMRNVTLENYPALVYNHSVWNKLYRRDFLLENKLRFVPPRCAEDVSFSIRTNLAAKSISITTRETYNYRFGRQIRYTTRQKVMDAFQNVTDALALVEKKGTPLLVREMQRKTARNAYASMVRSRRIMNRNELKAMLGKWQPVLRKMPADVIDSIPPQHSNFCRLVIEGRFENALAFREKHGKAAAPEGKPSRGVRSSLHRVCRKLCNSIRQ